MKASVVRNELHRMFPLRWELARRYSLPGTSPTQPYYISWNPGPRPRGEGWTGSEFDERGVLLSDGAYQPVRIAQFALYNYSAMLKGNVRARAAFFAQAAYLRDAQDDDGAYRYPKPNPDYGAPAGWISGMAQGEASSVLVRAFAQTHEPQYLHAARKALSPLERDINEGGASSFEDGGVFFEEVAAPSPCHILNGHLYAAFGLWEFVAYGYADERLKNLHNDAVETLVRWLPKFDVDGWSCYDLAIDETGRRHYAPLFYHHFHIAQLRVYARMTGRSIFRTYAERWNDALADRRIRGRVWLYNAHSLQLALMRRAQRRSRSRFYPLSPLA